MIKLNPHELINICNHPLHFFTLTSERSLVFIFHPPMLSQFVNQPHLLVSWPFKAVCLFIYYFKLAAVWCLYSGTVMCLVNIVELKVPVHTHKWWMRQRVQLHQCLNSWKQVPLWCHLRYNNCTNDASKKFSCERFVLLF